ncbi:MAG: enoyl-CoA hydratase-related protein [Burkholderiales bacterium]
MDKAATTPVLLREDCGDGVELLRINRPQVRNALNLELRRALAVAFSEAGSSSATRCIVLTGDAKAFCAGADLREYVDAEPLEIISRQMDRLWGAISECPTPIVAAVNGHAIGGGCELAMHADIIVAGESARFGQPEVRIGLVPGGGATQRLTRSVGKFAAMKLMLTGGAIPAAEARALGLVSEVVPDDQVLPRAIALAREIAALPALAVRQTKELILASMNVPLAEGLRLERKAFQLMFSAPEKQELMRAFLK